MYHLRPQVHSQVTTYWTGPIVFPGYFKFGLVICFRIAKRTEQLFLFLFFSKMRPSQAHVHII